MKKLAVIKNEGNTLKAKENPVNKISWDPAQNQQIEQPQAELGGLGVCADLAEDQSLMPSTHMGWLTTALALDSEPLSRSSGFHRCLHSYVHVPIQTHT